MSKSSFSTSGSASRPASWPPSSRPGAGGGGGASPGTCTWQWNGDLMFYEQIATNCNTGFVCAGDPSSYTTNTVIKNCVSGSP